MTSQRAAGPWSDAHCHLADPRLAPDLDEVIARSLAAGVVSWVQGGVSPEDWEGQRTLRSRLGESIKLSFGLHPWWVAAATERDVDEGLLALEACASDADAIGETGLDTYARRNVRDGALARQQRALAAQLQLAKRVARPLVLHVVRAHSEVLQQLERLSPFPQGGIVHAFTGTVDDARRYVDLGFHLSLGGALAGNPDRARQLAPIAVDRVLVETDAPDQAPRQWQVDRNEPAFLPRIAAALSPVWGLSSTELLDRARRSLDALFPA